MTAGDLIYFSFLSRAGGGDDDINPDTTKTPNYAIMIRVFVMVYLQLPHPQPPSFLQSPHPQPPSELVMVFIG